MNRFAGVLDSLRDHEKLQRRLYPDYDLPEEPDATKLADQAHKDMLEGEDES